MIRDCCVYYETEEVFRLCRLVAYNYVHLYIDVDSCLCGVEGINELARMHGKEGEVEFLTKQAMDGEVSFDDVFGRRLEIIQPREEDLKDVAKLYAAHLVPDAREVISALRDTGIIVSLLSGGYREAILPIADYLGIERCDVYANTLYFRNGEYTDFDKENPLCRRGGKRELIKQLRAHGRIFGPRVIIGDAVTEIEARTEVNLCIGFGGFVKREIVRELSDVFISDCTFAPLVPLLLHQRISELINYHPKHRKVLQKGLEGLSNVYFNAHARELKERLFNLYNELPSEMFEDEYRVLSVWKGY